MFQKKNLKAINIEKLAATSVVSSACSTNSCCSDAFAAVVSLS